MKKYYAIVKGKKVYTSAANEKQAAVAIANKTQCYVDPATVKEVKPNIIFKFARQTSSYDRTSYCTVVAVSSKQAWFFFLQKFGKQDFAELISYWEAETEEEKQADIGTITDVTWY